MLALHGTGKGRMNRRGRSNARFICWISSGQRSCTAFNVGIAYSIILLYGCCSSDSDCDDGVYCNGAEYCSAGICRSGAAPTCDDGVECTVDDCDPVADMCVSVPDDSLCDDSLWCTGVETCDAVSGCISGHPVDCDDGIGCTLDECDEYNHDCNHFPDHGPCSDGVFCNGMEECINWLGCIAGTPPDCSDAHECTEDSCDPGLDICVHEIHDELCDDSLWCTVDACDAGSGCLHDPVVCDDGVPCTIDGCDEEAGRCVSENDDSFCEASAAECMDGLCDPSDPSVDVEGCIFVEEPDGTPCTTLDICMDGLCVERTGCGDGYVEPLDTTLTSGPEECDDGNSDAGDSCDSCSSTDFQVNTSESWAEKAPSVAVWTDTYHSGNFIVAFEEETYESPDWTDVRFRRYDNSGNALDTEDRLLTTDTAGIEIRPRVVALPGGGFAAAWAKNPSDGDLFGIQLGLYNENGDEIDIVQVNTSTFGSQTDPYIAYDEIHDHILILWEDDSPSGPAFGTVAFRRFDSAGIALDTDQVTLPTGTYFFSGEPVAAFAPDGGFLALWTYSETGTQTDVVGRLFDRTGFPMSSMFNVVDVITDGHEYAPTVAYDSASSSFVVAWEQTTGTGSTEIAATLIDPADLTSIPDPVPIASPTSDEEYFSPRVSTARILVSEYPTPDVSDPVVRDIIVFTFAGTSPGIHTDLPYDIFVHRWISTTTSPPLDFYDGASAFVLTTTTTSQQDDPALLLVSTGVRPAGTDPSGALVGAWTDFSREGSDVDYTTVRARHLPIGWMHEP